MAERYGAATTVNYRRSPKLARQNFRRSNRARQVCKDSPLDGARFELSVPVREGQCSSRLARYGSTPFQTWKRVFGGSRKHFCCFTRTFSRRTITAEVGKLGNRNAAEMPTIRAGWRVEHGADRRQS